jgi:hypothetical protein
MDAEGDDLQEYAVYSEDDSIAETRETEGTNAFVGT